MIYQRFVDDALVVPWDGPAGQTNFIAAPIFAGYTGKTAVWPRDAAGSAGREETFYPLASALAFCFLMVRLASVK
jgi:hypothetical protein